MMNLQLPPSLFSKMMNFQPPTVQQDDEPPDPHPSLPLSSKMMNLQPLHFSAR